MSEVESSQRNGAIKQGMWIFSFMTLASQVAKVKAEDQRVLLETV